MVDETAGNLRVGRSHIGVEVALLLGGEAASAVTVEFQKLGCADPATVGSDEERIAFAVESVGLVGENRPDGIALTTRIG